MTDHPKAVQIDDLPARDQQPPDRGQGLVEIVDAELDFIVGGQRIQQVCTAVPGHNCK